MRIRIILVAAFLAGGVGEIPTARGQAGATRVECVWGKPQKLPAFPKCGVPRRVFVKVPNTVPRLMFAIEDNPALQRYYYRKRDIGAQPKTFRRMVNVSRTDLVLCPAQFQTPRVLSFRLVRGRAVVGRRTCELGKPGAAPAMAAMTEPGTTAPGMTEPGMTAPGMTAPGMTEPAMAAPATAAMTVRSVGDTISSRHPPSRKDLLRWKRAYKIDTLARLLGLIGVLLGLGGTVGVVWMALYLRRRLQQIDASGGGGGKD